MLLHAQSRKDIAQQTQIIPSMQKEHCLQQAHFSMTNTQKASRCLHKMLSHYFGTCAKICGKRYRKISFIACEFLLNV